MVFQFDPDCRAVIDYYQRSHDAVERILEGVQNKRTVTFNQSLNTWTFILFMFLPNSIGALKAIAMTGKKKMFIPSEINPTLAETRFLLRFFIWSTAERAKQVKLVLLIDDYFRFTYAFLCLFVKIFVKEYIENNDAYSWRPQKGLIYR